MSTSRPPRRDADLKQIAANSDGIVLMNYDQHEVDSDPGPIASQDWFVANLRRVLKIVPKEKLICALGNYGYDWTISIPACPKDGAAASAQAPGASIPKTSPVSEAWQRAADADADLDLDYNSLNPHFEYIDEDNNQRHVVWFLDGVTLLERDARRPRAGPADLCPLAAGLGGQLAVERVGQAQQPRRRCRSWAHVQPGHDVDNEGEGDILRVTGLPQPGKRTVQVDTDEPDPRKKLIIDEHMDVYPHTYTVQYYGYHPKEVALSFDDGPDPSWTPKILDILKQKGVKGTFMMIGAEAQENVGLMRRVAREGNEIGNHTYTHPDISEIPPRQLDLEVKLTERLFASKLGVQPLYFRPPYDIDEEPDTDDQAAPIVRVQQDGFIIVGNKIDTNDWDERIHKTPAEISQSVLDQLQVMKTKPQFRGSVILLHDGGGDRSATVAALPVLIDTLRAHGYTIVPVSALMGKTTAEVMPRLTFWQQVRALPDSIAFSAVAIIGNFIVLVFFVGDILMSARLVLVGLLRHHRPPAPPHRRASPGFNPRIAVLVPAYNEEKVIVRTIRSVLNSDYPNLHVIVIDDGSTDRTFDVAREAYAAEIAAGRVKVLTKPNGGKAAALNYALERLDEEIYVGIDADTVIAPDAITKLIPHFEDPAIGAVAGNAKVGNRVNLWTRWQALEYITSQNFERRALDLFTSSPSSPEPSAHGAPPPVKKAGGYPAQHRGRRRRPDHEPARTGSQGRLRRPRPGLHRGPHRRQGPDAPALPLVLRHPAGRLEAPRRLRPQQGHGPLRPAQHPHLPDAAAAGLALHRPACSSPASSNYFIDRHYHPEAASMASFAKARWPTSSPSCSSTSSPPPIAFSLERRHPANKGDGWLLFHIWLQRFAYRQVFSIVLFKTLKRAIDGKPFNWDKLERTAQMSKATEALTETR